MHKEIRWKPRRSVAHDGQHVSHNLSVAVFGNHHVGLLTRRLPRQPEELTAVEEVGVVERRQLLFTGNDIGF